MTRRVTRIERKWMWTAVLPLLFSFGSGCQRSTSEEAERLRAEAESRATQAEARATQAEERLAAMETQLACTADGTAERRDLADRLAEAQASLAALQESSQTELTQLRAELETARQQTAMAHTEVEKTDAELVAVRAELKAAREAQTAVPPVVVAEQVKAPVGPKAGDQKRVMLPGGVALELVYCPPGTFVMGSPAEEPGHEADEAAHRVTLTKGFWIGKYEVTQEQWTKVMGRNPSRFKGEVCPVDSVSWEDCQAFLQKAGNGLRLPSEAEWEYACRAGEARPEGEDLTARSWFGRYGTCPVGRKLPNAWGIHDMLGNVWEWCQDRYGTYSGDETDPTGAGFGESRVLRGGSWACEAVNCRPADRGSTTPDLRDGNGGFRVACSAD